MKPEMKISNIKWLLLPFLCNLFLIACKKDFNPDVELPRQFKPGDISITAGEIEAVLRWDPSLFTQGKEVTYTVEVFDNATFEGNAVFSEVVDTNAVTVTDAVLEINKNYYARVKANALGNTAESGWVTNSSPFRITGEQIFSTVNDAELTDSSVILKWRASAGLTRIVLTPAGSTAREIQLTADDLSANQKYITGLTQLTSYTAEIFRGNVKKGTVTFTTKEKSIFTVILNPDDDLVAEVEAAANGAVIGLRPGTYDLKDGTGAYANLNIVQKSITIQSFSGDPNDTKVNYKAIVLKGTGAGVKLVGINFDGRAGAAAYFIDFTGVNADNEQATFETVSVENCYASHTASALIRGNRGANSAYKIDSIILKNSIFYENGTGGFDYILLDKMEFQSLQILNSTFYNSGRRLIGWSTNFTASVKPNVLVDYVTINNIGYGGRDNLLIDANNNPIDFVFRNSIIANAPKPGQASGNSLLRAGNAASTAVISNSNLFKLTTGAAEPAALTIPSYVNQQNVLNIDLGWDATTTSFSLPAGSPLRTASNTNGPIGDSRWH